MNNVPAVRPAPDIIAGSGGLTHQRGSNVVNLAGESDSCGGTAASGVRW